MVKLKFKLFFKSLQFCQKKKKLLLGRSTFNLLFCNNDIRLRGAILDDLNLSLLSVSMRVVVSKQIIRALRVDELN